jgi:hypothetical protein
VLKKNGKIYDFLSKKQSTNYTSLVDMENEKAKNIICILDSFCISDEAYHELTLHSKDIVKSYLIKQCREDVNKTFSISQTTGPPSGAQLVFYETIDRLLDQISNESDTLEPPTVKLKLAADGAKVSRISSFLVLSLAVLNDGDAVMSSTGQHTLAIVSSDEKYFTIKECFCTICYQINNLLSQSNGNIVYATKPKKKLRLEIFLGGDMKYLLTVIGMNAANTNLACLYCKLEKKNRSDTSKPEFFTGLKKL